MSPDGRFPQKAHLKKTKEFRRVYNEGVSFRKDALILYRLNNNRDYNRFGVVVSSRTVKRAVGRNRIKRRLREIYRGARSRLSTGFDIVVLVKKNISARPDMYIMLETSFFDLAHKAGVVL